jgi:hypothetical protein
MSKPAKPVGKDLAALPTGSADARARRFVQQLLEHGEYASSDGTTSTLRPQSKGAKEECSGR